MKKGVLLVLMMVPLILAAQKAPKPNLNKALNSWKSGDIRGAKEMIDICVPDAKLSLDPKTFFYKGLIYFSIDTASNTETHNLDPNAFKAALDAWAKAEEMDKGSKSELFYTDAGGIPVLKSQAEDIMWTYYINQGANSYQDDNLETALTNFEKTQMLKPADTTAYFYAGFVSQALENYEKAVSNMRKYSELGGTSKDAYNIIINVYQQKEDKEKALAAVREAKAKFPEDTEFPKVEIGLLIDMDKIDEAKKGLEDAIVKEPENKVLHFYLGYVNSKLQNFDLAKSNFNEALKIDPIYFEAQYYLAQLYLIDADKIKTEMNNLGISDADKKKKIKLDNDLVAKYKIALPYWEKAEKLNPSDTDVLDKLSIIYYYLGEDAKAARVEKRLKELGVDN